MHRKMALIAVLIGLGTIGAATALAAGSPTVGSESVGSVADTSVTLRAAINPNGESTAYSFQYGLTAAYGAVTTQKSAGHGTASVTAATPIKGLEPGTVYHFRVVAQNASGQTVGTDHSFTTAGNPPPGVSTGTAINVQRNNAELVGIVNPNNQATAYEFEYGPSTTYGSLTPAMTVPKGTAAVVVSATVVGLEPGAEFHYRIIAVHSNSAAAPGADETFVTEPSSPAEPTIKASTKQSSSKKPPFSLTTSGSLSGYPSVFPAGDACTGTVKVQIYNGSKRVSLGVAPLQSDCTFSLTTTLKKLPKHPAKDHTVKLKVRAYFNGNSYIGPRKAKVETVTIG